METTAVWRVFIARYNETALLQRLVRSITAGDLANVTGGRYEVIVLNNHPLAYCENPLSPTLPEHVIMLDNVVRSRHSHGHLARDWNTALALGFGKTTTPEVRIVTTLQADAELLPTAFRGLHRGHMALGYHLIQAGIGDALMSFTVSAVAAVGLFDERFATILLQEIDYQCRAADIMPDRVSFNMPFRTSNVNSWANPIYKEDAPLARQISIPACGVCPNARQCADGAAFEPICAQRARGGARSSVYELCKDDLELFLTRDAAENWGAIRKEESRRGVRRDVTTYSHLFHNTRTRVAQVPPPGTWNATALQHCTHREWQPEVQWSMYPYLIDHRTTYASVCTRLAGSSV